jgi:hypothetical protein
MLRRDALRLLGALTVPRAIFAGGPQQKIKSIGLQLYTVRAALEADFDATLARVAAIGYREVEFAGYFGHSAQQVRASLRRTGLSAPSAHIPLDALGNGWQGVIENALAIGHRYLVVASVGTVTDLDGYRRIAERFNQAGEVAKKAGLRFAYHNHDFEFAPLAGSFPTTCCSKRPIRSMCVSRWICIGLRRQAPTHLTTSRVGPGAFKWCM